jgi:hypothetical protein
MRQPKRREGGLPTFQGTTTCGDRCHVLEAGNAMLHLSAFGTLEYGERRNLVIGLSYGTRCNGGDLSQTQGSEKASSRTTSSAPLSKMMSVMATRAT